MSHPEFRETRQERPSAVGGSDSLNRCRFAISVWPCLRIEIADVRLLLPTLLRATLLVLAFQRDDTSAQHLIDRLLFGAGRHGPRHPHRCSRFVEGHERRANRPWHRTTGLEAPETGSVA